MKIPYTKMQGAANDFIVIDNRSLKLTHEQLSTLAIQTCQHKFSIGADAVMAVDYPEGIADFRMRFYNADGTEAEMCGNGARCIARYAYEQQIAGEAMTIETVAGDVPAWRLDKKEYKVLLNPPTVTRFDQSFPGTTVTTLDYVELGNPGIPHAVVHYPGLADVPLNELTDTAKAIRHWAAFPKGANVNFYDETPTGDLVVRTFERGVEDFTFACGTGSGATAYAVSHHQGKTTAEVLLQVLGGTLTVVVDHENLALIGDAIMVSEGLITDENLHL